MSREDDVSMSQWEIDLKHRIDEARERDEPLHITPDEYRALKEREAEREDALRGRRGFGTTENEKRMNLWLGWPVVVDFPGAE